jgi:hypothetical protein
MRYLPLPALFVMFLATPAAHAQGLEHFESFSRAIGKGVSIVDRGGLIREGIVEAATADAVTMRFGPVIESIPRAAIASAERLKDDSSDGAFRGALLGLLLAILIARRAMPKRSRLLTDRV